MSNTIRKLRGIAENFQLYYVVRQTRAEGLKEPVMVVFEPNLFWWREAPVIVDAFPTIGSAAGRIKKLAKLLDEEPEWEPREDENDLHLSLRRIKLVHFLNYKLFCDQENRKSKGVYLG